MPKSGSGASRATVTLSTDKRTAGAREVERLVNRATEGEFTHFSENAFSAMPQNTEGGPND